MIDVVVKVAAAEITTRIVTVTTTWRTCLDVCIDDLLCGPQANLSASLINTGLLTLYSRKATLISVWPEDGTLQLSVTKQATVCAVGDGYIRSLLTDVVEKGLVIFGEQ